MCNTMRAPISVNVLACDKIWHMPSLRLYNNVTLYICDSIIS